MNAPDAELLLLFVQQRSELAFRAIVERHKRFVFSLCCRKLGDQHLAEDATQKVFVTLANKAAKLEPGPLQGYLGKTAMYICSDMADARAARARHERQYGQSKTAGPPAEQPLDEKAIKLRRVLDQLRENYREPLLLRYLDGLSVEAVGIALDLSPDAVKKRLVRGLAHLRQRMTAQGFTLSVGVAAGMLRGLPVPQPPADLVARIADAVFRSPPPAPRRVRMPHQPLLHVAAGTAGAVAVAGILTISLLPRPRPVSAPAPQTLAQVVPARPQGKDSNPPVLDFNHRLARRLPGLLNRPARFDFALMSLSIMSKIPIEPRWDAIEAIGVHRGVQFSLDLHDKNVLQDLDAILERVAPGSLEYVVSDGRIIVQPRAHRSAVAKAAVL